ncbi:uncharacterized protein TNCV_1629971 [Trichonephila clavipes]|uniref:Uncharacterized protein n=1 Tax=Trichonephila clavipes TaxID=2585209 RepID=A0A8X7B8U0_TRICX|nr:uncharacterized protein TNCV_1629971 [Trichonephila clavipes]
MAASGSFIPTPLAHADTLGEGQPRGRHYNGAQPKLNLYNPEVRGANGFSVLPEVYFSGSENVTEFLEGIDNRIRLLEIPHDLSCAYLEGHLLGRAQDWYQIFGSTLVQNTATDFAQLKRRDQEPTDLGARRFYLRSVEGMSEEALVDHIFIRLEPQVQDYVESGSNSSRHKSSTFESVQNGDQMSRSMVRKKGSGVKRELEEKGISFKKDQGERHTGTTDKRGPLIRSTPGFWSEPNRKLKMGRKETLSYQRSLDSGSGGPERNIRKDQEEEQKWSPDQPMSRRLNKEDQFESEEAEIISTAPTSKSKQGQGSGIPEAEVVNNIIVRRGKEERTATDPSPWRS